jgi:hypothetical protein
MKNEEAEKQRDTVRQSDSEKARKERSISLKERAEAINLHNAERIQDREEAFDILKSGNINSSLRDIAEQGGTLGRKIEREIKKFEQTGKVSSWLAGVAIKEESKQNAAQQAAFSRSVVESIQTIPSASLDLGNTVPPFLVPKRKLESPLEEEIPSGENKGDLLYWDTEDPAGWKILAAPQSQKNKLRVLTIQDETLSWTETEDCE